MSQMVTQKPLAIPLKIEKRENSEGKYISKYLACSEARGDKIFAIGIDIPGIGKFNTSQYGTKTPNCPNGETGSVFKSPKSLSISSIPSIDYSLPENIIVRNMPTSIDDFSKVVSDVKITGPGAGVAVSDWYIGISSKTKFTIHPKLSGYVFKLGDPRRNNASLSSCNFPNNIKPDMIRGTGGANFDTQFVFVNQRYYGISPESVITVTWNNNAIYNYFIGSVDNRHNWDEKLEYGFITVKICNHRIPWSNVTKLHGLGNEGRVIEIDVTDNYGNSGVITIKAPHNDASWPKLFVNGV